MALTSAHSDDTAEAIIVRHPKLFSVGAVAIARKRLDAGARPAG
jgi:hypothetical protein